MAQIVRISPGRRLSVLLGSSTLALSLLSGLGSPADAAVSVVAPATAEAPAAVRFTASATDVSRVSVLVDGRRRWASSPRNLRIRHSGKLRLTAGSHKIEVRAVAKGVIERTSKVVHVSDPHAKSDSSGNGRSNGSPSTDKASSDPGSGSSGSYGSTAGSGRGPTPPKTPVSTPPPVANTTPPVESALPPVESVPPPVESAPATPAEPAALPTFSGFKAISFLNQSAKGAISEVPDPAGSGESVFKMTVGDNDVYPITPTENPRAELVSPPMATNGTEFWATMKFFLPAEFPSSVPGWLTLLEGPYGPPFEGSPPWHIEVNGSNIQWVRNGTYGYDVPWSMPLTKNSWVNVMIHEKFAANGWIEMWINGQQINFFGGGTYNPNHVAATTRLAMQTMDASTDGGGGNSIHLMNYRERGMFESATVYEGGLNVGNTRASIEV
jgi:Polysaccharide lyase